MLSHCKNSASTKKKNHNRHTTIDSNTKTLLQIHNCSHKFRREMISSACTVQSWSKNWMHKQNYQKQCKKTRPVVLQPLNKNKKKAWELLGLEQRDIILLQPPLNRGRTVQLLCRVAPESKEKRGEQTQQLNRH